MNYIGVDIGGTKCAVTRGDETGKVLKKIRFETTSCRETLDRILDAVGEMMPAAAVGISCGGPLDSKKGLILSPPNLPGWDRVPVTDLIRDRFGIPAFLQNDANACGIAEWKFGAGRGTENMLFLTFGTGMGCGMILNGKLFEGCTGSAGEVGHIRVSPFGPVGYGKEGSFEGFCSGGGIAQLGQTAARRLLQQGKTASFCKSYGELETVTAKSIAECALAGAEDAKEVYRLCGRQLGTGLAVLIDVLNPEAIVLGSIFQRSSALLRDSMEQVLREECLPDALAACRILPAELGDGIGDCAALSVAMNGLAG